MLTNYEMQEGQTLDNHQLIIENQQLKEKLKVYEEIYNKFEFDDLTLEQHRQHLSVL